MDKTVFIKAATDYVLNSSGNYISEEVAISERVVGMKIFEAPIFGFGAPDDEYFKILKDASVIGDYFMSPQEWMPKVKTVISFFLPFSEAVRKVNTQDDIWPSEEWLHGRIEGQAFLNNFCSFLKSELINAGYDSLVPFQDERFWTDTWFKDGLSHTASLFTSNWSERHVAFVCGLGTFGLSKGLITTKGVAGRFGSVITELYLSPNRRDYSDFYEYCSMCGACERRCPVGAISIETGKNHSACFGFLEKTANRFKPRYGCNKCQTDVPCESGIPKKETILNKNGEVIGPSQVILV